jgi:hypothetical protein
MITSRFRGMQSDNSLMESRARRSTETRTPAAHPVLAPLAWAVAALVGILTWYWIISLLLDI